MIFISIVSSSTPAIAAKFKLIPVKASIHDSITKKFVPGAFLAAPTLGLFSPYRSQAGTYSFLVKVASKSTPQVLLCAKAPNYREQCRLVQLSTSTKPRSLTFGLEKLTAGSEPRANEVTFTIRELLADSPGESLDWRLVSYFSYEEQTKQFLACQKGIEKNSPADFVKVRCLMKPRTIYRLCGFGSGLEKLCALVYSGDLREIFLGAFRYFYY